MFILKIEKRFIFMQCRIKIRRRNLHKKEEKNDKSEENLFCDSSLIFHLSKNRANIAKINHLKEREKKHKKV